MHDNGPVQTVTSRRSDLLAAAGAFNVAPLRPNGAAEGADDHADDRADGEPDQHEARPVRLTGRQEERAADQQHDEHERVSDQGPGDGALHERSLRRRGARVNGQNGDVDHDGQIVDLLMVRLRRAITAASDELAADQLDVVGRMLRLERERVR